MVSGLLDGRILAEKARVNRLTSHGEILLIEQIKDGLFVFAFQLRKQLNELLNFELTSAGSQNSLDCAHILLTHNHSQLWLVSMFHI